jgi:hypothetical protein
MRLVSAVVMISLFAGACKKGDAPKLEEKADSRVVEQRAQPQKVRRFAEFPQAPPKPMPSVAASSIAADLSNVAIASLLTEPQRAHLARTAFVVSPGTKKELYEVYERARYDYVPIFVTSDSVLHVYHLLFAKTLRRIEAKQLAPRLLELDNAILEVLLKDLERESPPEAMVHAAAYFSVARKLLVPDAVVSPKVQELVDAELKKITEHAGPSASPIFPAYPAGEDYSQYVARGHYTKTPELTRYFLAMTWHGRMTFRVSDPIETEAAAYVLYALDRATVGDRPARELWNEIYEPTVFFVGQSDDLTPVEYDLAFRPAFGPLKSAGEINNESKLTKFRAQIDELRAPEVLGMVITREDSEAQTKGLRFMGQRLVPDSFVFRKLVHPNVKERYLPSALDFFAALGSERAQEHVEGSREYREKMEELVTLFRGYGTEVYTQNLYWSWIYSLMPLLETTGEGYPTFMRSEAWLDKQLNTAMGSWTELKHDTILYSKPVYAEMGAGGLPPPEPVPPKGYVEPVPELYARVQSLAEMTRVGLSRRGMLDEKDKRALELLEQLAKQLGEIARKELFNKALSAEEYELIRFYGGKIEELTFASTDEIDIETGGIPEGGDALQVAIVADVATDPNGRVLEEAVGRVFSIHAIVPVEGKLVLAEGGVFSHYEFAVPIAERLTNEAWRKMLDEGRAPKMLPYTKSFIVDEVVSQEAAVRIRSFTEMMIQSLWYTTPGDLDAYLMDEALDALKKQIAALKTKSEYIGRERLSIEFLSFDFRSGDSATVTTRERWKDYLNKGDPVEEDLTKLSERGPYETVVSYTLKKKKHWMISKMVHRPELPPFERP